MKPTSLSVLVVINGSTIGYSGGDLHAVAVANRWAARHTVAVLLPLGSSSEIAALLDCSVRIIGWRPRRSRRVGRARLMATYAARLLKAALFVLRTRRQWDVAVASSHFLFDLIPVALTSVRRCRRVLYWHHHVGNAGGRPAWVRAIVKLSEATAVGVVWAADAMIFSSSPSTRALLIKRGIAPSRVVMTRNSGSLRHSPPGGTTPVPWTWDIPSEARIVLFCGRLSRLKGTADLRCIARKVIAACGNAMVVVCGADGDDGDALRRDLASEVSEGRVLFTGFVDEQTKAAVFQRAHVAVVPSYEEGWGVTVGDGLAAGCWVVAYDLPAVRAAFPEGPRYVPLGDWQAFAAAAVECLGHPRPSPVADQEGWDAIADREMETIIAL